MYNYDIQIKTNLTQTLSYSTETHKKHVMFESRYQIISNFATHVRIAQKFTLYEC